MRGKMYVVAATQEIGRIIDKPEAVQKLLANYSQDITKYQPLLQPFTDRPVALVQFIDTAPFAYLWRKQPVGRDSATGLKNAYLPEVNYWGFKMVSTELAKLPKIPVLWSSNYPHNIAAALTHNTLWQQLPLAKKPLILPVVWTFGAIPSAQRFVSIFANGLLHGGETY